MIQYFKELGFNVITSPETATILLRAGISYETSNAQAKIKFQENLIKSMLQIENTLNDAANSLDQNGLICFDREVMDATTHMENLDWTRMRMNEGKK